MPEGKSTYDPIAIVGIGCRFPGGISDAATFWDVLINKKDAITQIPENRFGDTANITDAQRGPGKIVINSGGFLENIDQFDASFFNISNREAELMDPQQRIMLEIAFEAVEDAGWKINRLSGTKTGVYIGQWTSDYESRVRRAVGDIDLYATLGTGRYATAGRISYAFNLRGPSMVIDTHCSSSLVSVHNACQALRSGEVDHALAGGVNTILDPFISVGYSRSGILADYGRCRFGDNDGSGYVRSEGAGLVVLKRLSEAESDGDRIYAIIRSSIVNNDGRTNKYMVAPSESSQAEMLTEAYERAGLLPAKVHYIEAHGTGTKVGDPAEIRAINSVLGPGRSGSKGIIGSVKTNIGHTEAAAGIAGLLKTTLAVQKRQVPASLHMKTANEQIDWQNIPFVISQDNVSLESEEGNIYAGVNSFGITGTNAHVVLEEHVSANQTTDVKAASAQSGLIFPFSANSENALSDYAGLYKAELSSLSNEEYAGWIAGLRERKSDLRLRKAIVASGAEDLMAKLAAEDDSELEGIVEGSADPFMDHKVVFVFPGQGSQWAGMGRELYENEKVFSDEIDAWEKALAKHANWSLRAELFDKTGDEAMATIDIIQPALVAMEAALTRLWKSWGIEPDAVLGHSMGEVAAAYIAGILDIDDAASVICHRSSLMRTTSGKGAMGYIALTPDEMAKRLEDKEAVLGIAVNNSPDSVVVSGDTGALETLLEELTAEEIFCRKIKVDVASHSPQMDAITAALKEKVSQIGPTTGNVEFYSTVFQDLASGPDLNPDYWVRNLRQPVQFAKTVQKIIDDGATIFLEMSPHPVLIQAILENASHAGRPIATVGSLLRDEDGMFSFNKSVGSAWCNGLSIDWKRLYGNPDGFSRLPSYPWDREVFWVDESGVDVTAEWEAKSKTGAGHDLDDHVDDQLKALSFKEEIMQMDASKAVEALETRIKELTGSVVKKKVDSIRSSMAFKTLGIDSLMAVQLKEKLEKVFELPVSVTSFWTYATIAEYTQFISKTIGLAQTAGSGSGNDTDTGSDDIADEDISDLLASELEDLL